MWFDSHCHVSADEFAEDRDEVLARAHEAGVEGFIAIGSGYGVEQNDRAVKLAESDASVFATVGVHPHEAAEKHSCPSLVSGGFEHGLRQMPHLFGLTMGKLDDIGAIEQV